MNYRNLIPTTFIAVGLLVAQATEAQASARASHVFGVYFEGSGSSVYSANIGINTSDVLRLHAGTGLELSPKTQVGGVNAGAMYFFLPSNLSPFLGATIASIGATTRTPGIQAGGLIIDGGVDWTADVGFNLGVKVSVPLSALTSPGLSLFIGWYF